LSRAFVIYVIELIQLGFRHIFLKDVYAVGKKWPEMVVNWPNTKVVSFFNGQSLFKVATFDRL
jgi:hypothetical protein